MLSGIVGEEKVDETHESEQLQRKKRKLPILTSLTVCHQPLAKVIWLEFSYQHVIVIPDVIERMCNILMASIHSLKSSRSFRTVTRKKHYR
jgi:hypothetical protein